MYGLEIPYKHPRSEEAKQAIASLASTINVPPFVPNADKAKAIKS